MTKIQDYYGKVISDAEANEDRVLLRFTDGSAVSIEDHGQSCCEDRYITCDDSPEDLIGGELIQVDVRDGPTVEEMNGPHEQTFVDIQTNKSSINICTHNEHNGYYGGFLIKYTALCE